MFQSLVRNLEEGKFDDDALLHLKEELFQVNPYIRAPATTLSQYIVSKTNLTSETVDRILRGDAATTCLPSIEKDLGLDESAATAVFKPCAQLRSIYSEVKKGLGISDNVTLMIVEEFSKSRKLRSALNIQTEDIPSVLSHRKSEYAALLSVLSYVVANAKADTSPVATHLLQEVSGIQVMQGIGAAFDLFGGWCRAIEAAVVWCHGVGDLTVAQYWTRKCQNSPVTARSLIGNVVMVVDCLTCPVQRKPGDFDVAGQILQDLTSLVSKAKHVVPEALQICEGLIHLMKASLSVVNANGEPGRVKFIQHFAKATETDVFSLLSQMFRNNSAESPIIIGAADPCVQSTYREVCARMLHQITYSLNENFWHLFSPQALVSVSKTFHSLRSNFCDQIAQHGTISPGLITLLDTVTTLLPIPEMISSYLYLSCVLRDPDVLMERFRNDIDAGSAYENHVEDLEDPQEAIILSGEIHVKGEPVKKHIYYFAPVADDDRSGMAKASQNPQTVCAYFETMPSQHIDELLPFIQDQLHAKNVETLRCLALYMSSCSMSSSDNTLYLHVARSIVSSTPAVVEYEQHVKALEISPAIRLLMSSIVNMDPNLVGSIMAESLCSDDTAVRRDANYLRSLKVGMSSLSRAAMLSNDVLRGIATNRAKFYMILQHLSVHTNSLLTEGFDVEQRQDIVNICESILTYMNAFLNCVLTESKDQIPSEFQKACLALLSGEVHTHTQKPVLSILLDALTLPFDSVCVLVTQLLINTCKMQTMLPHSTSVSGFWTSRSETFTDCLLSIASSPEASAEHCRLALVLFRVALETQRALASSFGSQSLVSRTTKTLGQLLIGDRSVCAQAVGVLVRLLEDQPDWVVTSLQPLYIQLLKSILPIALSARPGEERDNMIIVLSVVHLGTIHMFRSHVSPALELTVRTYVSQVTPALGPIDITPERKSPDSEFSRFIKEAFDGLLLQILKMGLFVQSKNTSLDALLSQDSPSVAEVNSFSILTFAYDSCIRPLLQSLPPQSLHCLPLRYDNIGHGKFYFDKEDILHVEQLLGGHSQRLNDILRHVALSMTSIQHAGLLLKEIRDFLILYFDQVKWLRQYGRQIDFSPKRTDVVLECLKLLLLVLSAPRSVPSSPTIQLVDETYRDVCAHTTFVICEGLIIIENMDEGSNVFNEVVRMLRNIVLDAFDQSQGTVKWALMALQLFQRHPLINQSSLFPIVVQLYLTNQAHPDVNAALVSFLTTFGPVVSEPTDALVEYVLHCLQAPIAAVDVNPRDARAWKSILEYLQVLIAMSTGVYGIIHLYQRNILSLLSRLEFRTFFDNEKIRTLLRSPTIRGAVYFTEGERSFFGNHVAHPAWICTLRLIRLTLQVLSTRSSMNTSAISHDLRDKILSDIECFLSLHDVQFATVCCMPFPRDTHAKEIDTFTSLEDVEEAELVTTVLMHFGLFKSDQSFTVSQPLFPWIVPCMKLGLLTTLETRSKKLYELLKTCYLKSSLGETGMKGQRSLRIEDYRDKSIGRASASLSRGGCYQAIVDLKVQLDMKLYTMMLAFCEVLLLHAMPAGEVPLVDLCLLDTIPKSTSQKSKLCTNYLVLDLVPASSRKEGVVSIEVCREIVMRCNADMTAKGGASLDEANKARPRSRERTSENNDVSSAPQSMLSNIAFDVVYAATCLAYAHVDQGKKDNDLSQKQYESLMEAERRLIKLLDDNARVLEDLLEYAKKDKQVDESARKFHKFYLEASRWFTK
eukprot:PhF_6_TR27891/c0_g1_i2/m.40861